MRNRVAIYADGELTCLETTHTDPDQFVREIAEAVAQLIEERALTFSRLVTLLPEIVEIACKLKGYKANVEIEQLVRAGMVAPREDQLLLRWPPEDHSAARIVAATQFAASAEEPL